MKVLFILLLMTLVGTKDFAQSNNYYVKIPLFLKESYIGYNLYPGCDTSFQITFSGLPHRVQDAGFFFFCDKKFKRVNKNFFDDKSIFSPEMVMDSLTASGRSFFRNNTFYVFFSSGEYFYIHKAKGEYIFMDYRKE